MQAADASNCWPLLQVNLLQLLRCTLKGACILPLLQVNLLQLLRCTLKGACILPLLQVNLLQLLRCTLKGACILPLLQVNLLQLLRCTLNGACILSHCTYTEHCSNPLLLPHGPTTAAMTSHTAALKQHPAHSLLHALKERLEVPLPPELGHELIKHLVGCLEEKDLHCSLHN
jgi:hypothetical protein